MTKRPFSEKSANQLLHKAMHGSPDDEAAAALARDWRTAIRARFTFTPQGEKVLDALTSEDEQLIQSTLTAALAHRRTPRAPQMKVHFVRAPDDQTRPVRVRVERGHMVGGTFQAITTTASLDDTDKALIIGFMIIIAHGIADCFGVDLR